MDRASSVELIRYRSVRQYKPKVGDVVIRHGWWSRTKWFGVVSGLNQDGSMDVIKDGSVQLLVTGVDNGSKTIHISALSVVNSIPGSFTIMQNEQNGAVWFV